MKKALLNISVLLFILSFQLIVRGQEFTKQISFQVINAISNKPVELAYAFNSTQAEAATSDLLGYFKLQLAIGDTLNVSSLGYFTQVIYSWGQYSSDSAYYVIKMKPRSYVLKELKFTWFADYQGFLKGFLELKIPITKEEKDVERISDYFKRTISNLNLMNLPQASSGGTFGRDWLAKQNDELKERLEKERQQRAIARKFSAGIIEALTGLKGNEVFWFMEYCAFTDDYILMSSDYEIRLRIMDKFKIYNQDKTAKDKK